MSADWPRVPLGDLLQSVSRQERVAPVKRYRLLGAHWYAKGLYVKDEKPGNEIRANAIYRVEEGDFVYNRLFAWMGSFAVADQTAHGCYVSNEFPCYRVNHDRLDGRFLWLYFRRKSSWAEALGLSSGGTPTSRNRLKEEKLLGMTLPLPPLAVQRRIVARVDAVAARIAEARRLREEATAEIESLRRSILHSDPCPTPTPMTELVRLREPDVLVQREVDYDFAGVYCFGRGVFRGTTRKGIEFSYDRLTTLHMGNFVYPKLMAWEGALAVVPAEHEGLVVSTEFPVFDVNVDRVLPEVLDVHFRTPSIWPLIAGASTGTNVRRRRLNPNDFLKYVFPLPSRETQHALSRVGKQVDQLRSLQAETAAELDALLPTVLAKAFAGGL